MPPETDGEWEAPVVLAVPRETLTDGRGHTVDDDRDLFVIHGVLLYTGKVLLFCGHTEHLFYAPVSYVFDPQTGTLTRVPFPNGMDLFCCHYVQLPDGRVLVVGGSDLGYLTHRSRGAKNVVVFDPQAQRWELTGHELAHGRWYPTAVLLGDGRVVVVSGRGEPNGPRIVADVEVLAPPRYEPRTLQGAEKELPIYPGLHLLPDGRIFYTHTNWGQEIEEPRTTVLTVDGNTGTWNDVTGLDVRQRYREEGMSVALPQTRDPAKRGRILVVGGSRAMGRDGTGARRASVLIDAALSTRFTDIDGGSGRSAEIVDAKADPPTWTEVGPMDHPRINGHCVLLPDQSVLVLGGHDSYKWNARENATGTTSPVTNPSLPVEIFREDATPRFQPGAPLRYPRMYHSVALLLNDGRVFVAGGADPNDFEEELSFPSDWQGRRYTGGRGTVPVGQPRRNGNGRTPLNRKDYEIYRPPYWFRTRPRIGTVSRSLVGYGQTTVVTSVDAASITTVAIMRPGAVTHHTDSEQRYVELAFARSGNDLTVTMPGSNERSLAPPGWYMLWIVDGNRTPCGVAHFIRLEARPCVVATVAYGSAEAPAVAYLRALRDELAETTKAGRRFVGAVDRAYYSFSPALARFLDCHARSRAAVRDGAVRPAVALVRASDRAARKLPATQAVLMVLLTLLAMAALATAPLWLAVVAGLLARRPPATTEEVPDAD